MNNALFIRIYYIQLYNKRNSGEGYDQHSKNPNHAHNLIFARSNEMDPTAI